ncbi:MAG: family 10 glycosylhydrolase [Bacteroidota bacterium]
MKTKLFFGLFLIVCSLRAQEPVRAFWLTNVVSDAMFTAEGLDEVIEDCETYAFNTIYVVGWNRGYTQYQSALMGKTFGTPVDPQFENFDPIQYLIDHARPKGIRVILWFEFGFSYRYQDEGNPALEARRPEWIALNKEGNPAEKNGFYWWNALDTEVQDFLIDLIAEAVIKYEIDGIQGDDRLPAMPTLAGYNEQNLQRFEAAHSYVPIEDKDSTWVQWRANQLTHFLGRLYQKVKTLNPALTVSLSPSIYPWSQNEYLQDWPAWVKHGWVDELLPQVYRYDFDNYQKTLQNNVLHFLTEQQQERLFPGILLRVGDYYAEPELLRQCIELNRSLGIDGESFFYYEGIEKRKEFFKKYAQRY